MKEIDIKYPLSFSLTNTLYDQITIRDWILEGLPNDSVSIENSIIAKKGKRYPLMIDPQMQANKWLKMNEGGNKLSVVSFNQTHYLKALETSINCGYPVLIEEVEESLESSIDSILEKKVQLVEGLKMTVLGDKKIAIDEKFYLYMTTRLSNPKFLAEIFNKSTVINFSITFNGLKDQLLSDVCKK
jgi:dynein heavy chain